MQELLQSLLGGLDQSVEAGGIVDSHFRQHLAVQLDASLLQAVHEAGVVHALSANSVVDAGDPQVAELTLLLLTNSFTISSSNLIFSSKVISSFSLRV